MRFYLTAIFIAVLAFVSFGQNQIDAFFPQGPSVYTQVMEDLDNEIITQEEAVLYILQSVKAHDRLPKRYINLPMERSQSVPMKEAYRMLANMAPTEGSEITELLERPTLSGVHSTEHFDIHFETGTSYGDVATYIEDSYDYIHTVLGYLTPPSDGGVGGSSRYDIYITSTSSGVLGYAAPEATGPASWPDATSYVVISTQTLAYGLDYIKSTVVHEYFHSTQFGYDAMDPENFYYEHSSCWIEKERWPGFSMHSSQMPAFFNYPEVSLREYNGEHEYGSYHFNEYVDQTFGRAAIREIWEATRYSSMLNSLQTVFMDYDYSRTSALAEFWVWNYFTGSRATPHGEFGEADEYPTVAVEADHITYPANGSVTGLDNYGVGFVRFNVPGGASGPFSLIFDGDADAIWSAQVILINSSSYEVRDIALNAYGYGVLELDSTEYDGIDEIVLVGGVVSQSGEGWSYSYTGQFAEVSPTFYPARNLVAESDRDSFVPLEWDNPVGASIGGYDIISYDDGIGGGTLPMATYSIDFEGVSFTLSSACTLKQVILMGAASATGNVTVHVYAGDGTGYGDMGTEFGTGFSASISAFSWDTTAVPGGGIYLDAGTYFIGYDRTTENNAVLLDAATTENRSKAHTSGGSWADLTYDYLFRIGIKSVGSSGGLTNFNVYRGLSSGGPYSYLSPAYTSSYIDSAVTNGTSYYYVVTAQYGGDESSNSNQAMAVPNATSSEAGLMGDCELTASSYYRFGPGNAAAQEFNIDRPVQITQILYLTTGSGYFMPAIHPYSSDRVQRSILPEFTWAVDSTQWQIIDVTDYRIIVNDDFLVSFEWIDTSVYLGYAEVSDANCWTNFGLWAREDSMQFSIMCVVREIDTTVTYTLEGTVNLDLGSGGSSGSSDLSGSIVSILGTDMHDTTDIDGYYRIEDIPPGYARVKAWHSGYESQLIGIGLEMDLHQNFSLLPMGIPKNPPQDLMTVSYLDAEVPLYWNLPLGAPGTWEELSYFEGPNHHIYVRSVDPRVYLTEDDVQCQKFNTNFPCSLMYTGFVVWDPESLYGEGWAFVWADDGEGYPNFGELLCDSIEFDPTVGGWTVLEFEDPIFIEGGQDFHIGIKNAGHNFAIWCDSIQSTDYPTRSKIFYADDGAWGDSLSDYLFVAGLKYSGYSDITPIDGGSTPGYIPDRPRISSNILSAPTEMPAREYFGICSDLDTEEFEVMEGYNIYRSDTEDGEYSLIHTSESDTFHYVDYDVENGNRYWYKLTTMYFHGESDYAGPATALPLEWRDSADVLIVDDDGSSYIMGAEDVFDPYGQALDAIGLTYNVYEPCCTLGTPGPDADMMAEYDAVVWFTGEGWADRWTITEEDEAELAEYIDAGGAVAIFGSDYLKDRYDGGVAFEPGTFARDYLGIERIYPDNWHIREGGHAFLVNGFEDGFATGQTWEATAEYYAPDSILADFFHTHSMQDILGIERMGALQTCAVADYSDNKVFFTTLPLEALTNHEPPNTREDFMDRLFNDYLWATIGDTAITLNMDVYRGWNMVSVPVEVADPSVNIIFPGHVGDVYSFNPITGGYDSVDSVLSGYGYFALFAADTILEISGMPINSYTHPVYRGWNMTGSVFSPESVSIYHILLGGTASIVGDVYIYNPLTGGYDAVHDFIRGKGSWMLIDDNSLITVPDTSDFLKDIQSIPQVDIQMQLKGHSYHLGISSGNVIANCLPPAAPGSELAIPAYLDYDGFKAHTLYNNNGNFELIVKDDNLANFEIPEGYVLHVDNEILIGNASMQLSRGNHEIRIESLPEVFAITGISPNPFNPETSIEFMIPEKSEVDISIFDIDGRLVKNLSRETYSAGKHSIVWHAGNNAAGIYLVKISTPEKAMTERLLLVK